MNNLLDNKPLVIFSLTDTGMQLANQIKKILPQAKLCHKPASFIETVQTYFKEGNQCVFVCATGIVIRALAPVLDNKLTDPAVIVLDEKGQYVIPLLSGHEGGANQLASKIADNLKAKLVLTSAHDYTRPVYVAGMGCDKGCPEELLLDLYNEAIAQLPDGINVSALASIDIKQNEAGLIALTKNLVIPFECYSASKLREVEEQLTVKSEIVFKEVGCYGVAEAAALINATELTGNSAELILPKLKNKRATIAFARSYY